MERFIGTLKASENKYQSTRARSVGYQSIDMKPSAKYMKGNIKRDIFFQEKCCECTLLAMYKFLIIWTFRNNSSINYRIIRVDINDFFSYITQPILFCIIWWSIYLCNEFQPAGSDYQSATAFLKPASIPFTHSDASWKANFSTISAILNYNDIINMNLIFAYKNKGLPPRRIKVSFTF